MKAVAAILILSFVSVASAQPCGRSSPIKSGEIAPCDGILLPRPRVLRCLKVERVGLPSCLGDLDRERKLRTVDTAKCDALTAACDEDLRQLRRVADEALDHTVGRPWYEHPALLVVTGVVVGGLATYGLVQLTR